MSFSNKYKTLKSGNIYKLYVLPEVSADEKETTEATQVDATDTNDVTNLGFSTDLIEEKVKANLEPLQAPIPALTQMMDRIIQGNSVRDFTTASTRKCQFPSELPLTDEPGTCQTPPTAPITTTGYSSHTVGP